MKSWKIYSIVVTVILVLVIIGVVIFTFFKENISQEEAKSIAVNYAGTTESGVTFLSVNKDRADREYEVKFYDNSYEYEVDVNYNNGTVGNFEKDVRENVVINDINKSFITEEEAKEIALQRAGKKSGEVTFTRVKEDRENGVTVYDVYFYDNEKEYEISVDVNTKEVVVYKEDYLNANNTNTTNTDEYIGIDRAKEIALQHAGLDINSVTFNKAELDVEASLATYELEFHYNYTEYDYEINAITGEVLKFEKGR